MYHLNETEKCLLGALDMLHTIKIGGNYSSLEYHERTNRYAKQLAKCNPALKGDPYYKNIFRYID